MTAVALRRPPPDTRQLQRCLLLAVLMHVWLVLMFGNTTGTAAPGQGVWGSLTVKLLGRSGGEPGAPPGEASPVPAGAAQLGRQNPQQVPPEAARSDEPSPAPPSTATLDLPEGFKPVERLEPGPPPLTAPNAPAPSLPSPELPTAAVARLEAQRDAAVAPLTPAARLRTPNPPVEALPQANNLPAAVSRLEAAPTPSPADTALPRPADLRATPPQAALAPGAELPAPVQRLEAPDAAVTATRLPRTADLRTSSAVPSRLPAATALPAPVQRLEAPSAASTAPLPRPGELRAASPAATAALPGTQDLPTAVNRLEAADAAAGVTPLQRAADARAGEAPPVASTLSELAGSVPSEVSAPAGPARGDPSASPYAAPKASAGSPDAGPRLGPDLPSPPTAAASAPRAPLNLSLPRGDMTARRSPGLVELLPPPPERKSKLEQAVEDATNKDCRKAYSGGGLLAVVPLAVDAVRGKGCKW